TLIGNGNWDLQRLLSTNIRFMKSTAMRIKILSIILLLFFSGITSQAYFQYPKNVSSDRAALMDLYEATGGEHWDNNSGWGEGEPSNEWYGIKTNGQGRVIRVDLWKNNLKGQLPESVGNLDKVTYLNVKNNKLTGEIPSSIGDMA